MKVGRSKTTQLYGSIIKTFQKGKTIGKTKQISVCQRLELGVKEMNAKGDKEELLEMMVIQLYVVMHHLMVGYVLRNVS